MNPAGAALDVTLKVVVLKKVEKVDGKGGPRGLVGQRIEILLLLETLLVATGSGMKLVVKPVAVDDALAEIAMGATDEVSVGSGRKLVMVVMNPVAAEEETLRETPTGPVDEVALGSGKKLVMVVMKPVALVEALMEITTGPVDEVVLGSGTKLVMVVMNPVAVVEALAEMMGLTEAVEIVESVLCVMVTAVTVTISVMVCPRSRQFQNSIPRLHKTGQR